MALISVVVPVYHNAGSLPDLHAQFAELARRNPGDRFEFVYVDDGSRDDSYKVLCDLAAADGRVRVVKLSRNFGSTAAIRAGLEHARGVAVGVIAADLQDPPGLLHEMLGHWRAGKRVVLATRATRGDPILTRALSKAFYALFRRLAVRSMPAGGFDFFLVDRSVCDLLNGLKETNGYLMGLVLWLGFEPAVLSYHRAERPRRYGRSMWTLSRKLKYFADAFAGFSYAPIRAASLLGFGISLVGFAYAAYLLAVQLLVGQRVEGWTSLMVVMLVVSGVQLTMTGILGEYLWRALEESRRRPRYVVERVVERPGRALAA